MTVEMSTPEKMHSLMNVHAAFTLVENTLNRELAHAGLDTGEIYVLYILSSQKDRRAPTSYVADRLGLPRSTTTNLINSLTKKGLVVRAPMVDDRRRTEAVLTAKGERVLSATLPLFIAAVDRHLLRYFEPGEWLDRRQATRILHGELGLLFENDAADDE